MQEVEKPAFAPIDGAVIRIVDGDPSFRSALRGVFTFAGYDVLEFASVPDYLAHPADARSGCLVLDVHLTGPSGLDLQDIVTAQSEPLPMVFVTAGATAHEAVRAFKAGAADFFFKPVDSEVLVSVVTHAIANAEQARSQRMNHATLRARYERLSPRERQVLALVVKGSLNKQISMQLGAAERTVKAHRAHLMEKLEVRSVAELVTAYGAIGFDDIGGRASAAANRTIN